MTVNLFPYSFLNAARTVFCACLLVFLCGTANANGYTVENIEVDVTAANAVEAREQAFEQAQVKGFRALAEQMLTAEELEHFEVPDINIVAAYVQDFEVTNEQLSATRYKGTYTIRYNENSLNHHNSYNQPLENQQNQPEFSDQPMAAKTLIIPFYKVNDQFNLWQFNPFMEAWVSARVDGKLGSFVVPYGSAEDMHQFSEMQPFSYDPYLLNLTKERYGAQNIFFLVAEPRIFLDGQREVIVRVYKPDFRGAFQTLQPLVVRDNPQSFQTTFYGQAVDQSLQHLRAFAIPPSVENASPTTAPVHQGPMPSVFHAPATPQNSNFLKAQLNFNSMREWIAIKERMERTAVISSVSVETMSPRFALITLQYQGDLQALQTALQQVGLGFIDQHSLWSETAGTPGQKVHQLRLLPQRL